MKWRAVLWGQGPFHLSFLDAQCTCHTSQAVAEVAFKLLKADHSKMNIGSSGASGQCGFVALCLLFSGALETVLV